MHPVKLEDIQPPSTPQQVSSPTSVSLNYGAGVYNTDSPTEPDSESNKSLFISDNGTAEQGDLDAMTTISSKNVQQWVNSCQSTTAAGEHGLPCEHDGVPVNSKEFGGVEGQSDRIESEKALSYVEESQNPYAAEAALLFETQAAECGSPPLEPYASFASSNTVMVALGGGGTKSSMAMSSNMNLLPETSVLGKRRHNRSNDTRSLKKQQSRGQLEAQASLDSIERCLAETDAELCDLLERRRVLEEGKKSIITALNLF
ncbi:hypothetical protein FA15DRAFT_707423 [Coprinopsis marcescibilis]|uniref:Uncharacterized protein n=1 Tax=Coprinopsis marcescibilis TaxID=230819 RepID=A0A5C3KLR6_COPMA|nr:hypothetical protein FA15DRAFT_707423 [Coprinopsis marcescibilis]